MRTLRDVSHLAWLVTYPIAGWVGADAGFTTAWSILAVLAVGGAVAASVLWPRDAGTRDAGTRDESEVLAAVGDTLVGERAQSAAGTLAAGQCSCVRPV